LSKPVLSQATQAYYACVSFVDAQVGRLLDGLNEFGLSERTIVVFWSDHGYHLGEHNGIWQKRTLFEQGARAPLIIRAPRLRGNGQACRRVVEFVDIYPSLIDVAGLSVNPRLAGRSLRPLLENPAAQWNGFAVTQVLRPADERLAEPVMGCSIRTNRWRYTEWAEGRHGLELYDHHADPQEFNNLAKNPDAASQRTINRLSKRLRKYASGETPKTPFNSNRL
jgi:uncharacterized sulfatase